MSNEYEYNTLRETVDASETVQDASPRREVFVPREPNPSAWPVSEVKFSVTRGEMLFFYILAGFLAVILLVSVIFFATTADDWTSPSGEAQHENVNGNKEDDTINGGQDQNTPQVPDLDKGVFADGATGSVLYENANNIKNLNLSGLSSTHAALASMSEGKLIAANGADEKIYPASITKVMTLIVAVEYLKDDAALQQTITISEDIVEAMAAEGASGMGLAPGEKLTVEALLYALMLKSDGVAACQLARHIAGTEEAFVALMNQKAKEMGLTSTHFENPTGLHHENHYSTCRELATIMGYAMNMSLCRRIMTEDAFDAECTTSNGDTFPYHIYHNLLVTYFNQYKNLNPAMAGTLKVIAGKTGYTPESKFCLATCSQAADGSYYVCVTVGADSYEDCIKAYQPIYVEYAYAN